MKTNRSKLRQKRGYHRTLGSAGLIKKFLIFSMGLLFGMMLLGSQSHDFCTAIKAETPVPPALEVQIPRISGVFSYFDKFGDYGTGEGEFHAPFGVAINTTGYVYVTDEDNDQIQVFNASGEFVRRWGSSGSANTQFSSPEGIAINTTGHVYIADSGNDRIQVFDELGTFVYNFNITLPEYNDLSQPYGIAINQTGHIYVSDYVNNTIKVFDLTGKYLYQWGGSGTSSGLFDRPGQIAINSSGYIYSTDRYNHRVQVFDQTGVFVRTWGSEGTATSQFQRPNGIAIDGFDNVYVVDSLNSRIQVFNHSGVFNSSWGSLGGGNNQFTSPNGIAVNSSLPGYIYVADTDNSRIQVFGNTPPNATNVQLSSDRPANNTGIGLTFSYQDRNNDPQGDPLVRWYINNVYESAYDNLTTLPANATHEGDKVNATVSAFDGIHYGPWNWSNTGVVNFVPTVSNVQIQTIDANSSVQINLTYSYNDLDGDDEAVPRIRWYRNNTLQPLYNDRKNVSAISTERWDEWNCTIEVHDGIENGTLTWSDKAIITNSHPIATLVTLSPGTPGNSSDITVNYVYFDNDGDARQDPEVFWYRNNEHVPYYDGNLTLPDNATHPTEQWNATVFPFDGFDYGPGVNSTTVTINTPPTITGLVTLEPAGANSSSAINLVYTYHDDDGDDEDTPPRVRWYKDNALQTAYNDLTTLPMSATKRGEKWNATIEVNDGIEYGVLTPSSNTLTIQNAPAVATNVQIAPSPPKTLDDLVLVFNYFDNDGDLPATHEIIWRKNNVPMDAYENQTTVPASATNLGEKWNASIRVNDSYCLGEIVWTQIVTIGNILPQASGASITPYPPYSTDALLLNYTYSDAEGDPEGISRIQWYKDNVHQPAFDNLLVVPATSTAPHEQWRASVEPYDGYNYGSIIWSNPVIIKENIAPAVTHPADLTYQFASTGHRLSWTVYDETARDQTYIIYKNGTVFQEALNWTAGEPITLAVDGFEVGSWNITIIVNDGLGGVVTDTVIIAVTRQPTADDDIPGISIFHLVVVMGISTIGLVLWSKKTQKTPKKLR